MDKDLQKYISFQTRKKHDLERELASKKRSLELVNEKLSDPEFHLNKELGRGAVKVKRVLGDETVQKPKTVLKKNVSVPTASGEVAPAAVAVPEDEKKEVKKSSWSPFA